MSRLIPICAVAAVVGCTRLVGGTALPLAPSSTDGADLSRIMLDTPRIRALVGADEQLTIIPTMDSPAPADIDELAATVPPPCRFIFAETAVFGTRHTRFRKITFQYPPNAAIISQAAAIYPDPQTARQTLDALAATVAACADSPAGTKLVGDWAADPETLRSGAGACGSAYQLKSVVLLEVTYCGFTSSDADLVLTNMAANVTG
ncbi:sensor domain-containing protein [Mycolicibacter minnesotensis]